MILLDHVVSGASVIVDLAKIELLRGLPLGWKDNITSLLRFFFTIGTLLTRLIR